MLQNVRKLGEVLVGCQYIGPEDLEAALSAKPGFSTIFSSFPVVRSK